jgi:long-chain acyl-CoA synthetase
MSLFGYENWRGSCSTALVWQGDRYSYDDLTEKIEHARLELRSRSINQMVVGLRAEFSPRAVATFIALLEEMNYVALLPVNGADLEKCLEISESAYFLDLTTSGEWQRRTTIERHPIYKKLREEQAPAFVVFTSGSGGFPKAAVHRALPYWVSHENSNPGLHTLLFMNFDHLGGINTLFYVLARRRTGLIPQGKDPISVLEGVDRFGIELLPTTPSFLNLLILARAPLLFPLPQLKMITYGTEPVSEATLQKIDQFYPHVKLLQTYGSTEFGVIPTRSKNRLSSWIRFLEGENCKIKIRNRRLYVKTSTAMVGYLNYDSPIEDGWIDTGDMVEQAGEFIRILGRNSELINIGGEKVMPQEIEEVLLRHTGVVEVLVYAEENKMLGNIICADIVTDSPTNDEDLFSRSVKIHCHKYLAPYKVPMKVDFVNSISYSSRMKKMRPTSLRQI